MFLLVPVVLGHSFSFDEVLSLSNLTSFTSASAISSFGGVQSGQSCHRRFRYHHVLALTIAEMGSSSVSASWNSMRAAVAVAEAAAADVFSPLAE